MLLNTYIFRLKSNYSWSISKIFLDTFSFRPNFPYVRNETKETHGEILCSLFFTTVALFFPTGSCYHLGLASNGKFLIASDSGYFKILLFWMWWNSKHIFLRALPLKDQFYVKIVLLLLLVFKTKLLIESSGYQRHKILIRGYGKNLEVYWNEMTWW